MSAAQCRRGTVVAHVRDLLFSSRIAETARRLGYPFQAARSLDDLRAALAGRPSLVMLDLTASGLDMDAALREIEAAGRPAPVLGLDDPRPLEGDQAPPRAVRPGGDPRDAHRRAAGALAGVRGGGERIGRGAAP